MKKYVFLLAMITTLSYASEQPTKKTRIRYSAKELKGLRPKDILPSDDKRLAHLRQLIEEAKKKKR